MDRAGFDAACRALPAVTMVVQWGESQVYKVGGKMFASLGVDDGWSVKCSDIAYAIYTEDGRGHRAHYTQPGSNWIGFDRLDALPDDEIVGLIASSHALIAAKLPKARQRELGLL